MWFFNINLETTSEGNEGNLENKIHLDLQFEISESKNIDEETIQRLIKSRNEARRNKNFDMADEIRNKLKEKGVEIEDTSEGTIWRSI